MKMQNTTFNFQAESFPDDLLTNSLGIPQTISLIFRPVNDADLIICEEFCTPNSTSAEYATVHAITSTSKNQIHSSFILRSEPAGKTCYLLYRFQPNDFVTIENTETPIADLFSSQNDIFDTDELVDNYHWWMLSCLIGKLKEAKYFSAVHNTDDIELLIATEA